MSVALGGFPGRDFRTWSVDHMLATMRTMKARVLGASEFKAKCLACLSEVERSHEPITITRRGRPVAVIGPIKGVALKSPRDSWARKGRIIGDIVNFDTSGLWGAVAPKSPKK